MPRTTKMGPAAIAWNTHRVRRYRRERSLGDDAMVWLRWGLTELLSSANVYFVEFSGLSRKVQRRSFERVFLLYKVAELYKIR